MFYPSSLPHVGFRQFDGFEFPHTSRCAKASRDVGGTDEHSICGEMDSLVRTVVSEYCRSIAGGNDSVQ